MMVDTMLIPNIPEEPNLALRCKHSHTQSMDWSIAKPFVVEATSFVEPIEIGLVWFVTPEVEGSDFEVREELTIVILVADLGIEEPGEIRFWMDEVRMGGYKGTSPSP